MAQSANEPRGGAPIGGIALMIILIIVGSITSLYYSYSTQSREQARQDCANPLGGSGHWVGENVYIAGLSRPIEATAGQTIDQGSQIADFTNRVAACYRVTSLEPTTPDIVRWDFNQKKYTTEMWYNTIVFGIERK